ncbi:MAG: PilZ domain-containing protein [Acidobacteriia bacterium]|nr:PilZ domain-containing protein [Terriglobia bacterium]
MNPLRNSQSEQTAEGQKIGGERRSDRRYDLALNVRWKLIRRRRVLDSGIGTTVDVSSGGLLFQTDRELPSGLNIELSIAWPVLLRNVAPLQLVVAGRVVRTVGQRVGVRMTQHEFRTVGVPVERRTEVAIMPWKASVRAAGADEESGQGKIH